MSRVLYFDCFSGISGDMTLGALIDAGLPLDDLRRALGSLALGEVDLRAEKVLRTGVSATKFSVRETTMKPEPGAPNPAPGHPHRHLPKIFKMIDGSSLSSESRDRAKAMFQRLGEVEAEIHQMPVEKVHLHEVGALDSIIDIVGTVFAMEWAGADRIVCSPLNVGGGMVKSAHGVFPVPAPATVRLLGSAPVYSGAVQKELVTPTGALIATTYASSFGPIPAMSVERVGYGAGDRDDPETPNVLRVLIGQEIAGLKPCATSDPDLAGLKPCATSDPDLAGLKPCATSDPDLAGLKPRATSDPDLAGLKPCATSDPGAPTPVAQGFSPASNADQGVAQDFSPAPNAPASVAQGFSPAASGVGQGFSPAGSRVTVIECEIDDMNPQIFGLVMDRLYAAGALEVFYIPVQMKKNRPGTLLTVVVPPALRPAMADVIFRETTTIGLRHHDVDRECLERNIVTVATPIGTARVKVASRGGQVLNATPEFDDCVKLAEACNLPLKEVQAIVMKAYRT